ncbi:Lysophospholipase L1 [Verrucomicrobium sp. GAS474]|uniref:SGNH/GDSL hydrolase family protein n=1 Tax=Verrucomicrobium sp. GAS474 TaxID=1882831 RepID=UPI00087D1A25|nr:SGNH/GDSL hydrolase family protein [Verrucomicrobium sp. GAS474]SDU17621.1 Lysophospholipase L1 [Verrucomicrobium sp. GAS474]
MKRVLLSLLFSLGFGTASQAAFLIQPNDVVAICGDSITEQQIYSVFVEDYLLLCQPTPGQRIVQLGWGGERVGGFLSRLQSDLYPFKPTVVTTCYGMNDGGYVPVKPDIVETYRKGLTDTVADLKKNGVRSIVLGTPGVVDSTTFKRSVSAADYNENLRQLSDAALDVSQKEGVNFADVHGPMMEAMGKAKAALGDAYVFAGGDGVHPGPNGHLLMAGAILKGLGCDGAIGTITVDLASGKGEGTPGQKIVSVKDGTVEVESTRLPFFFEGDPKAVESTPAAIVAFTTFNEDLNRYLLVVKGFKGDKAKVTWSSPDGSVSVSQVFPAADLEKGVNLAAAFIGQTPLSAAFQKVHNAVKIQQSNEVPLVKGFFHGLTSFKKVAPRHDSTFDDLKAAALEQDETLFKDAVGCIAPVRHLIKIESAP